MKPKLKVTERLVQTTDGSRVLRYYTAIDHSSRVSRDEFIDQVHNLYGIPVVHILSVLEAVSSYTVSRILSGSVVEVPYAGLFKLTARAKTTGDPRQAGDGAVSRIKVNYLPCKEVIKKLEI